MAAANGLYGAAPLAAPLGYGYGHGLGLGLAHGPGLGLHGGLLAAPLAVAHAAPAGLGGNGFGHGGHFSPVPVQTVKLVGVPQPVPVGVPTPVDAPYTVPVDRPYAVPVDKPIAAPYVAKVIQPQIHKQTVISSHILPAHK